MYSLVMFYPCIYILYTIRKAPPTVQSVNLQRTILGSFSICACSEREDVSDEHAYTGKGA